MPVTGIKAGAISTLTKDLKGYISDIKAFPMKIKTADIEKAIKGSKTETALRSAIKKINTSLETELNGYLTDTIRQLEGIEAEYKRNAQSATGINTAVKKS